MGAQDVTKCRSDTKGSPGNHNVGIMEENKCYKTWKGDNLQVYVLSMPIGNTLTNKDQIPMDQKYVKTLLGNGGYFRDIRPTYIIYS